MNERFARRDNCKIKKSPKRRFFRFLKVFDLQNFVQTEPIF